MYGTIDRQKLEYPGHYTISKVYLLSYRMGPTLSPLRIDITHLLAEINIFESLDSKTLTGNIVVSDAQAIPIHLPLTGFERVEFKVFTPGCSRGYDFTSKTGHPMHIFSITKRQEITARSQAYVLEFCSKELITNEQTRVSKPFKGATERHIFDIVRNTLNSKKPLFLEETKSNHQFVIPRVRPLKAIEMLSSSAFSKKHNTSGMKFYETANGFHLRSYENLLAITSEMARPVVAKFVVKVANMKDDEDIVSKMQQVMGYSIDKQFDTLQNYRSGVYCSRMVTHDMFNKTFSELDFNYQDEYVKSHHIEHDGEGGKQEDKSIAPRLNFGDNKYVSDFPEGRLMFHSKTEKTFNNFEGPSSEINAPRKISYQEAFNSQQLTLEVPGFTGLSVGDLIAFDVPPYEPANKSNPADRDPHMSGRYLVKNVRHIISFSPENLRHKTVLECIKDSTMKMYPQEIFDTFSSEEVDDSKTTVLQYELDETQIDVADRVRPTADRTAILKKGQR